MNNFQIKFVLGVLLQEKFDFSKKQPPKYSERMKILLKNIFL